MTEASGAPASLPLLVIQTDQSDGHFAWKPGAVWPVTHHDDIQFFPGSVWHVNDYEWPLWDDWGWIEVGDV